MQHIAASNCKENFREFKTKSLQLMKLYDGQFQYSQTSAKLDVHGQIA